MSSLSPSKHRAFSLIELLVSILILGTLIAILLPALAAARTSALTTTCMSNQRQIGTGIGQYAVDFQGVIPYGPKAKPTSIADFYVVDGMVTSQLSILSGGRPVGIGLLLDRYLQQTPRIIFCPDTDQAQDAARELSRVGVTQAVSSYIYRHGSNTLATASQPRETWPRHIQLENLGRNSFDEPITALLMDQNFIVNPPLPLFNVVTRTNHQQRISNILFADGHVETRDNTTGRYNASIGSTLHLGPEKMLGSLEQADLVP